MTISIVKVVYQGDIIIVNRKNQIFWSMGKASKIE